MTNTIIPTCDGEICDNGFPDFAGRLRVLTKNFPVLNEQIESVVKNHCNQIYVSTGSIDDAVVVGLLQLGVLLSTHKIPLRTL